MARKRLERAQDELAIAQANLVDVPGVPEVAATNQQLTAETAREVGRLCKASRDVSRPPNARAEIQQLRADRAAAKQLAASSAHIAYRTRWRAAFVVA